LNRTERTMVDILQRGKEQFGVVSVKAEFEAEGTRMDELLRLVDIARAAGLPLTVKIGGCEAVRDLLESKQIGVRYIVAPMVETPYALSKYISAKNLVFMEDDRLETNFLFNLETITGFSHVEELAKLAVVEGGVQGIVFGRVDFSGSMGLGRNGIESQEVTEKILSTARVCSESGLDLVVGGAVSIDALSNLRKVRDIKLTRFETRKVVFSGDALELESIESGLLNAVHFELLWLTNKRDYYNRISQEDDRRIEMLENRWKVLNKEIL
jgi:hypothetical protein